MSTLKQDEQLTAADRHALASSIVGGRAAQARNPPNEADLAGAIQSVNVTLPRKGSPSLVVTLLDPSWHLLDSGFFDADGNARLDGIVMNYPEGSRFWWALNQVSPSGSAYTLTLTFIPRLAWAMMRTARRRKSNRGSTTRAEFLRGLVVDAAREHGFTAEFYCSQLDAKQAITKVSQASTSHSRSQAAGQAHKTNGVSNAQSTLTCNGKPLTAAQKQVVNVALGEAEKQHAPKIVVEAMIYAGMGETGLTDEHDQGGNGPWQQTSYDDPVQVAAHYWLLGGHGFQAGGGIACARANPHYSAWQIANAVEANGAWIGREGPPGQDSYALHVFNPANGGVGQARALAEAQAIVGGGGYNGSSSGTYEVIQPYYFTVGTTSAPHEAFWDASQRISQEVNWDFIIDGDRAYYDSEMTLIKQKVALEVARGDLAVTDWGYDWDSRNIATNFSLSLMAGMFEFGAADVFQMMKFGTASNGSTAGRPGAWLVDSVTRDKASLSSTIALVQPTRPKKEPAPTVKTVSVSGASASSVADVGKLPSGSVDRAIAAAQVLSNMQIPYVWGGGHSIAEMEANHPAGLDCSGAVSWVLYRAGMLDAPLTSGDFETWGDPGHGNAMTVQCNQGHAWIQFNGRNLQLNTVTPGDVGARLESMSYSNASAGDEGATNGSFVARHFPGT